MPDCPFLFAKNITLKQLKFKPLKGDKIICQILFRKSAERVGD